MLPKNTLIRTNFLNGMKFNPEQIKLTDQYYDERMSLLSLGGIGKGILVEFASALKPVIKENLLIIEPGAALDSNGNLLFVDKSFTVLDQLQTGNFQDQKTLYVYLKYNDILDDLQESRDGSLKLHYQKIDSFKITTEAKNYIDKSLIEIARVFIDQSKGDEIKLPKNPFEPKENEIDIRFAPKIISANCVLSYNDKLLVSNIIRKYANFLNELGFKKKLFSASTASTVAYKLVTDIKTFDIATWQLYDMLFDILDVSMKIKDEEKKIQDTGFWKNVERLKDIFEFNEDYKVDFYEADINSEDSFFYKILLHFNNAVIFDGDMEDAFNFADEEEKKKKEFLLIGSGEGTDIRLDAEDVSEEHAKLYPYRGGFLIEDMLDTNGIFINSERLEVGVKRFINIKDYVVLGKKGALLNLNHPSVQELNN